MSQDTPASEPPTEEDLDRIERMDRRGPTLRSVLETNPEALAIADALDAERRAKGARGPLHGIPVLLKDNVDTHDRNFRARFAAAARQREADLDQTFKRTGVSHMALSTEEDLVRAIVRFAGLRKQQRRAP